MAAAEQIISALEPVANRGTVLIYLSISLSFSLSLCVRARVCNRSSFASMDSLRTRGFNRDCQAHVRRHHHYLLVDNNQIKIG